MKKSNSNKFNKIRFSKIGKKAVFKKEDSNPYL